MDEGYIDVGIKPNADGAAKRFQAELEAVEAKLRPVDVELAAKLAKGFAATARQQATAAVEKVRPTITIGPKLAKGFTATVRAEARKATSKVNADVTIRARSDVAQIRTEMEKAEKRANAKKPTVQFRAAVDVEQAAKVVTAAVQKAQRAAPKIDVKFEVSDKSLSSLLSQVAKALGHAQTAANGRPIDVRFDTDPEKAVAKTMSALRQAQAAVKANPIDVRFDVDPAKLAAQVSGATAAAGAAAPSTSATSAAGAGFLAGGGARAGMAAGALLVPGALITGVMASSTGEAINLAEAQTKVNTVFEDGAPLVLGWAKNAEYALGQSQSQALEAAGTYGNLLQAFGLGRNEATKMSIELASLASDLASFNNTEVADALVAIQSGLSGETEPLKRFGVALSDVRLKEQAVADGIIKTTKDALTPAMKAQAAYALIMKDTTLAQGDFARNSDGVANQQKILQAQWLNLKAVMGEPFGVALQEFLPIIRDTLAELTPEIRLVSVVLADSLASFAREILPLAGPFLRSFTLLFGVFVQSLTQLTRVLLPVLIPLLNQMSNALAWMANNAETVAPIVNAIVGAFGFLLAKKVVVSVVLGLAKAVGALWSSLTGVWGILTKVLPFLSGPVVLGIGAIAGVLYLAYRNSEPFREAIDRIAYTIREDLWPAMKLVGQAIAAVFSGDFSRAGELMGHAFNQLKVFVGRLVPALKDAGSALLDWFGEIIPPALAALGRALSAAGAWLVGTGLPWLVDKISTGAAALWGWIQESTPKLIAGLGVALEKAYTWLFDVGMPALGEGFKKVMPKIWEALTVAVPALLQGLLKALRWVFTGLLPFLVRTVGQLVVALGKVIIKTAPKFIAMIFNVLKFLGTWLVATAAPWLAGKFGELIAWVFSGLGSVAGKLIGWLWDGLSALGGWLWNTAGPWLWERFTALLGWIWGGLGNIGEKLVEWARSGFEWLREKMGEIVGGVLEWFRGLPGRLLETVKDLGGKLWEWAKGAFDSLRERMPEAVQSVLDWVGELPAKILEKIGDAKTWLLQTGKDMMQGLWDGITSAAGFVGDVAAATFNALAGFVNDKIITPLNDSISSLWSKLPFTSGKGPQIPEIPLLAKGGLITAPTLAVVGEAGPELVLPLTDPARMAELLRLAGITAGVTDQITSAAPATLELPDTAPVTTWTSTVVAAVGSVPGDIATEQAKGMAAWTTATQVALTMQSTMWNTWAQTTTAQTTTTWDRGLSAMVAATITAGQMIGAAMEGAISTSTPRLVTAVQGYATALTGALNPVLGAIGADPIVLKFAEGGSVPGPRVNRDIVPALLMPGEVVIRRSSVDAFGAGNLLDINAGRVPAGWQIPRFAEGGLAAPISGDAMARATRYADAAVGKPYVWGGVGPNGFDCSGLWSGIISAVRDQSPRRLFTSSSLLTEARKIGMLPGLGQISVGTVVGNPGHVGGTIAGTNYEATPPRVVKGAAARGANHSMFTNRFHVGSGLWLEPGQTLNLPGVPDLTGAGVLSSTAMALLRHTDGAARAFADANTFATATNLGDVIEAFTGESTATNARGWITEAMRLTGVPASWLPGLMTIARRESAFNPRAINQWDSNAARGIPSKGLMQTIDPTFRAYALPGHGDIWNPVHNAAAAIRYILARYGDISRVQQANPNATPRGYAAGGLVMTDVDGWRDRANRLPRPPGGGFGGAGGTAGGFSAADIDRLVEAIGSIDGQTFHLGTSAETVDGQAASLAHRFAAIIR